MSRKGFEDKNWYWPKHLQMQMYFSQKKPGRGRRRVHNTFPFIPYGSPPCTGTGTPQVKSRVRGVGTKPPFSRSSMITPSELITAFGDHFPTFQECFIHSSVRGWISSNLRYMCADCFVVTTCALSTRHRGLIRSIASSVRLQPSHWSPRASWMCDDESLQDVSKRTYLVAAMRTDALNKTICQKSSTSWA